MAGRRNLIFIGKQNRMKFLGDMGISTKVIDQLKLDGHDSIHVAEIDMATAPDSVILKKARSENRILLTHDFDFGDILAAGGDILPSVIIFRLNNMRPENVYYFLKRIIISHGQLLTKGVIVSVNETRIRVRKLPIS